MTDFEKQDKEVMGSDPTAAGGRCREGSEWPRSAGDAAAPTARKLPGTATGKTNEFEEQDKEVMDLVNKGKRILRRGAPQNDKRVSCDKTVGEDRTAVRNRKKCEAARRQLWLILKIFICALVAVLFVAALLDPDMVPAVANLGVLSCGCVAAVSIDRHFRRCG